jgi:hypothetical protein
MSNLNDTQSILLSKAGQRDSGSLYPLPATLLDAGGAATKAVATLIKRALAEERETEDAANVVREDADFRYGIFIGSPTRTSDQERERDCSVEAGRGRDSA